MNGLLKVGLSVLKHVEEVGAFDGDIFWFTGLSKIQ